ncbi:MAG: bacterial transcriptional activator domain-containing protein [Myxococcota bacterium]
MGWLTRVGQLLFGWSGTSATNGSIESAARSPHYQTLALYWSTAERFMESSDYERASDLLERAVRLDPKQTELHNALGQCLVRLGRREDAATSFRNAASAAASKGQKAWAKELHDTADWLTPVPSATPSAQPRPVSNGAGVSLLESEATPSRRMPAAEIDLTGGSVPVRPLRSAGAANGASHEASDVDGASPGTNGVNGASHGVNGVNGAQAPWA